MQHSASEQTAAPASAVPPAAACGQFLSFTLQGEGYAIVVSSIREILEYASVRAVPLMPAYVRGVINLRGSVVPVIDLNARFGRSPTEFGRRTCLVILESTVNHGKQVIGVLVDAVNAVLSIPATHIESSPAFGAGIRTQFLLGFAKLDDRLLFLLDADHVLAAEEFAELSALSPLASVAAG